MYITCVKCSTVENEHEVKHSKVVDRCIDVGIIAQVEFINEVICNTRYSCQGKDDFPAGVSININDWPKFEKWLSSKDYTIGYADNHFYGGDIGWGIKMPKDMDVDVWHVPMTLMTHITFNVDHKEMFV